MSNKIKPLKDPKDLPAAIIKQMLTLATSGFGLVAALAWNEVVKETVSSYIKPHLPEGSTILSLFLYALIVTILAVLVTLQLTKLQSFIEENGKSTKKKSK